MASGSSPERSMSVSKSMLRPEAASPFRIKGLKLSKELSGPPYVEKRPPFGASGLT